MATRKALHCASPLAPSANSEDTNAPGSFPSRSAAGSAFWPCSGRRRRHTLALIGEIPQLWRRAAEWRAVHRRHRVAVTFRYSQTPLVTLDLKDPAHPKKVDRADLAGFRPTRAIDATTARESPGSPLDPAGRRWSRAPSSLSLFVRGGDLAHRPERPHERWWAPISLQRSALGPITPSTGTARNASTAGSLAIPFGDCVQPAPAVPGGADSSATCALSRWTWHRHRPIGALACRL